MKKLKGKVDGLFKIVIEDFREVRKEKRRIGKRIKRKEG